MKIAVKHRVERIRDYERAAARLIESLEVEAATKSCVTEMLFGLIDRELDIAEEVHALATLYTSLYPFPQVILPTPWPDWWAEEVLAMEWIEGEKFKPWAAYPAEPRHKLVEVIRAFHRASVARTGLFRYDNHWSNFVLTATGKIGVLDYGIVVDLTEATPSTPQPRIAGGRPLTGEMAMAACGWVEHYLTLISTQGFFS